MHLHWHRSDLRIEDNATLEHGNHKTAGMFVLDPGILECSGPARTKFLLESLNELRERYTDAGSELAIFQGSSEELVPEVALENEADVVTWGRDYTPLAKRRDRKVESTLEEMDLESQRYLDGYLHGPEEIYTNAGDPYQVYSYYYRKWKDRQKPEPVDTDPDFVELQPTSDAGKLLQEVPELDDIGFDQPVSDPQMGGRDKGLELMHQFLDGEVYSYAEERDVPAAEGTSRLSPHLHFGTLGARELWHAVQETEPRNEREIEGVEEFESQLAWREFYNQVLHHHPYVITENFKDVDVVWRNDPEEIEAWRRGETGYPFVDAGMRQLLETGFIHNRVRMVAASFLTKDLLADWRYGYRWFRKKLVDHDAANDNGGWQWASSTGTDSQPYFRVFNPVTQGEKYDSDCRYIKRYVPALRGLDSDDVHGWSSISTERRKELAPGYPEPIVDHAERREIAIEKFGD
ncbi:MAG: deoxyribodipyrimidine photo-lyase [Halobacteria archaeon]